MEQICRWHITRQGPPDHPGVSRPWRPCRCSHNRISYTQPFSTQLHPGHNSNERLAHILSKHIHSLPPRQRARSKQNPVDTIQQRSKQNAGSTKRWLKASTTEEAYVWVIWCPTSMVPRSQGTLDFTRYTIISTGCMFISTLRPQSTVWTMDHHHRQQGQLTHITTTLCHFWPIHWRHHRLFHLPALQNTTWTTVQFQNLGGRNFHKSTKYHPTTTLWPIAAKTHQLHWW